MLPYVKYLYCIIIAFNVYTETHSEVFTAISDLESLLHSQQKIIAWIEDYLIDEEQRFINLTKSLKLFETDRIYFYVARYLENPINVFRVIKRLTFDIDSAEIIVKVPPKYIPLRGIVLPTRVDLTGAAEGLARLQYTYHVNVSHMADGDLRGIKRQQMSESDCYAVGTLLYSVKDFKHGVMWMEEAYKKFRKWNLDTDGYTKPDIAEGVSFGYLKMGKHRSAARWQRKQYDIRPFYLSSKNSREDPPEMADEEEIEELQQRSRGLPIPKKRVTPYEQAKKLYNIICRGNMKIPSVVAKVLKCRYLRRPHPFLQIAPMKAEDMYLRPKITFVHGILNDDEIQYLKTHAKAHKWERSVINVGGKLLRDRIAKLAGLPFNTSSVLSRISRKVSALTGLNMDYAEDLQVVNYGIGGFQDIHVDYCPKTTESCNNNNGNRLATVLFYLTDVDSGGTTVFHKLGVSVRPKKGAALLWGNLHPSGQGDPATLHASCPIIHGNKWVANAWISQIGNEFTRPCTLEHQENAIIHYIPRPVRRPTH